jgi:DNA-binding NarL/FixJ family response regulator
MKRLLIIADHSFVVEAIRLALRQTAGFKVVGFIDGRKNAALAIRQAQPDVVLVDEMQQSAHALERLRETAAEAPNAKTLLLTLRMEQAFQEEAFAAGAHAIVSKTVHPVSLGTLVREIANGNVVHSYRPPAQSTRSDEECPLTERELEILMLVAEGLTNSRIARKLWVTEQTVKFHLSNTYRKLGVANRTEASRYAYTHDLVGREPARLAS